MDDELVLLGVLSGSAMHGYQLNDMIEHHLPLFTSIKPSTAYSRLDRLATRGLVRSRRERVGRRPERKVYELTEEGRARFLALLRENLRSAEPPSQAGDAGVLFHRALPEAEVLALLAERRQATVVLRDRMEEMKRRHPPHSSGYLVAERALVHAEAEERWLDSVIERGFEE